MAQPYLDDLTALLARVPQAGATAPEIACKHFFSGAAAYADGVIFMTLTPAGLALKLCEADCAALLEQGARPLQYFPNAPVKKDYVVLADEMRDDPAALAPWVSRSLLFTTS